MKTIKTIWNTIFTLFDLAVTLVVAAFLLFWIAGNASINCNKPSWLNHNFSCTATVMIPSR